MQRWYAGDAGALERLVADNLDWMREHVRRHMPAELRPKCDSTDFVHDGVVKLLRFGPRYAPASRAQFRAFVAEVLVNVVRSQRGAWSAARRDLAREQALPDHPDDAPADARVSGQPDRAAERAELRSWLELALELLPPLDRRLVELRLHDERTFVEIAAELGLDSADAARKRLQRVLPELAVLVKRLESVLDSPAT
ncbi:MAG: sigma-70 family RNA polymerase sigma factor [Planctomycetes bacterium]|nr:sigma-70 family RNA polymerase sigma factor [Planctomycetota bacterium]